MNILRFEFTNAPHDSYNGYLGSLVQSVRHLYSQVPGDQIEAYMPKIRQIEGHIQRMDLQIARPHREYVNEILEALQKESEKEELLMEEIREQWPAIAKFSGIEPTSIDDFWFEYWNIEAVQWLVFNGFQVGIEEDERKLKYAKEVFRAACYKHEVVFIEDIL